jgi:ABC-type oligopeptide transport system substrate-binding subunit
VRLSTFLQTFDTSGYTDEDWETLRTMYQQKDLDDLERARQQARSKTLRHEDEHHIEKLLGIRAPNYLEET